MTEVPRIAIVITCFNYEAYVGRAIASVRAQTVSDYELVVVDDGSTDGSWDVIARSGVRACRIANGGQRAACLHGLDQTRAPFVLFLDADDELKPEALATILPQLDGNVAKLQYSLTRIAADGTVLGARYPALPRFRESGALAARVLATGVYQSPPTSGNVFRRDLCDVLRDAGYEPAVDGVILFAAPFLGDVVSLDEDLALYRVHDRNDSGLGRAPEPRLLQRDLDRFLQRMAHLRTIVARHRPGAALVEPRRTFYFQTSSFALAIASGRRPGLGDGLRLVATLASEPARLRGRLAVVALYLATILASRRRAQKLLAYRFGVGRRSLGGLIRAAVFP